MKIPVNTVPGRMVSKLDAKLDFKVIDAQSPYVWCKKKWDYFLVWFKLANFKPFMKECWFNTIALRYDKTERRTVNAPGVTIKPQYFGLTEPVEFLWPTVRNVKSDYFYSLVETLRTFGYRRNVDIFAAPYDWRKATYENKEFIASMDDLIEKAMNSNHGKPVVIICHSLGCIYTHHYLTKKDKSWKKGFVRAMISIAAPYGGEFRILYSYLGLDDSLLVKKFPIIRIAERTFSSTALLLPSPSVFRDKVLISAPNFNYTAYNYDVFFTAIRNQIAFDMWLDSKDTLEKFEHPGVDVYCIAGVGVKTMESLDALEEALEKDLKSKVKKLLRIDHGVKYGNGDGFVNALSAARCLQWRNNLEHNFIYNEFPLKHLDLVKHQSVIKYIMNVLTNLQHT
ncbi:group XV phospholipase A2-like protein [Leptotrombidium deliense]|uniref:Group XV phospholipase A2-like protein n=1 Tax=Leptotrombidium deliense TaxID=299467 RepID=A0A443SVD0_9ACAR|nr:group XV phospholipase A2-like protein [Leptotrombidium deliense]